MPAGWHDASVNVMVPNWPHDDCGQWCHELPVYRRFPATIKAIFEPWQQVEYLATGKAEAASHPFHIHVNPFQVVMKTRIDGKCVPMNVWRDTLYIREGETYTIRSRFRDFLGKTVFHCHILDHEDQGMMSPIQFIPPYQTPAAQEKVGLQPKAVPAPALKLARGKGAPQTLADLRPHPVILVFFQGAECAHCTTQLAELVRQARMKDSQDIEIVAVSSRAIADPAESCERLGAKGWPHFHLHVDPDRKSFSDFGCDDGGSVHGLFLIDAAGVIRARYVGKVPYDDPKEAVRQVHEWVRPR